MYPIVLHDQATINLANLYIYTLLRRGADDERFRLRRLVDQVNNALTAQADRLPNLKAESDRLKREIRLITKGTPLTEPLDSASSQPLLRTDLNFNQQQYDAETLLLKKAYKAAAQIAHPDKGGSKELFAEVTDAYLNRDLHTLTDLYITISKGRNLYWQQSDEGVEHLSTQYEMPKARSALLKASPVYAIARLHIAGHVERASIYMEAYMKAEIAALLQELNHLGAPNGQR